MILNTVEANLIYLFGSYAYGTPKDKDSDFDIYVGIQDGGIRPIVAMQLIIEALIEFQRPVDILVRRASDSKYVGKLILSGTS